MTWTFVKEPCVACAQGIDGKNPYTPGIDNCKGTDAEGRLRPGRLSSLLTQAQAKKMCNDPNYQRQLAQNVDGATLAKQIKAGK